MINHLLSILTIIIIYEILNKIKFFEILKLNFKIYKKLFFVFKLKKANDARKEKVILNYSQNLFISSIKLMISLLSILIFFVLLNKIFPTFIQFILRPIIIIEMTLLCIVYIIIKKKIYEKL